MKFGRLTIYVVGNTVIIPTLATTKAGYYLETEPVARLDLADPGLPAIVRKVLERGNPVVPTPSRARFPMPVVLKFVDVASWKEFVRIAVSWQLAEYNGTCVLARSTSDSAGAYWGGKEKIAIPLNPATQLPDSNAIVAAILSGTAMRPPDDR
jgi:hypothetical protein